MMDHLTCFAILTPIPNKSAETVARVIIDRLISVFGPPETLHSDQLTEFENKIIHQLRNNAGLRENPNDTIPTTRYLGLGESARYNTHDASDTANNIHL